MTKPPLPRPGLQHGDIGAERVVARRVGERLGHHAGGAHVVGDQVGATQPFLARVANADAGGIGEAVRPGGPAQFLRALAIGVVHRLGDAAVTASVPTT